MQNEFSIKEISEITGKSPASIYRYIKSGKLLSHTVNKDGQPVLQVRKQDLESFIGIKTEEMRNTEKANEKVNENHRETSFSNDKPVFQLNEETLQKAIFQAITQQQTQIMKPMEEHAFYIVGELKNELKHIHAEKETLRHENELLREQLKSLPGPVESIQKVLIENAENMALLQKEREELLKKMEEYTSLPARLKEVARKLHDKEQEITALETTLKKEKDDLEFRLLSEKEAQKEELEAKLQQEAEEKAKLLTQAEEQQKKAEEEKKKLLEEAEAEKTKLKTEAEEREKQIAEAWKKELELARKPWWKFW